MHIRLRTMIAALGLGALAAIALSAAPKPLPSDEALRARFLGHRADFEKLVAMANEDNNLTRIALDFTWLDDDVSWPRKDVGISAQRWTDYRQIFQKVGASEGILNYTNPTLIFFPIASMGLVPAGSEKGLVYSQTSLNPVLKSLDEKPSDALWDGPDRSHVLAYKPIGDHWYIYYKQW